MKEPGQVAAETYAVACEQRIDWPTMSPMGRQIWARVEAAVLEEAAKVAEQEVDLPYGREMVWAEGTEIAAAIRALKGGET